MPDYRLVGLELGRPPTLEEEHVVRELNRSFSPGEISLESTEHGISIKLNRLDLDRLKSNIYDLTERCSRDTVSTFRGVLEQIESVRSYGIRAGKRIYVRFNAEYKVKDRKVKAASRGSRYYARGGNFRRKANRVPGMFTDTLICGDSEEVLRELPENSVDLILTSPPYNFGLDYVGNDDGVRWTTYFDKLFGILSECVRVTKYGGRIAINVQPLYSDYIPLHHLISKHFMEQKMIWRNEILWEKNNYNAKYTAWGSWKSPSNPYMKYTWEFLEVFSKGSLKHAGKREDADITADEFKEWVNAKWSVAPERRMREFDHPAVFPEKLAERVIKLFSFKGDFVLDPFNGVGTSTLVAKRLDRRFLGIDISEEYVRKARERMGSSDVQPDPAGHIGKS